MCTNYRPTSRELIEEYFGAEPPDCEFRDEVYPGHFAPIIRLASKNGKITEQRECVPAVFGLIPYWSKDGKNYRHTYNARSETVFEKPSYRSPWRKRQFCIVPMEAFYEPNYATGKPVRWRIERQDKKPFGVAAIYDAWKNLDGEIISSFSMLTVNADGHALMGQFHPARDEKRSVVVVEKDSVDDWLAATTDRAVTYFSPIPAKKFGAVDAPKISIAVGPGPLTGGLIRQ